MTEQHSGSPAACPHCGSDGTRVGRVTLKNLLRPESQDAIDGEPFYVCSAPGCDTVYFRPNDGRVFGRSDLTVRFGLKETEPPRTVCYCFDHTIEEIEGEIARSGRSTAIDRIKASMKRQGCRCEQTNPLGRCCLNSVQAAVSAALESAGRDTTAPDAAGFTDCCGPRAAAQKEALPGSRAGILATGGSVLAALLSSACCWLPLLLVAFGASAAGVAGFFEAYRLYFITGAVVLLGLGFYMVYFRKAPREPGSACATSRHKAGRLRPLMLWAATGLVGASIFFPNYVGRLLGSPTPANVEAGLEAAAYHIDGMTCQGCADTLGNALAKLSNVKGVEVDYENQSAVVRFLPDQPVPPRRVIEAVQAAGYSAKPAEATP